MVVSYLEYEWAKIDQNHSFTAKITLGTYVNPENASDIRYCKCMGKGKVSAIKGTNDKTVTVPMFIASAFGEYLVKNRTRLYVWDAHIPSLKKSKTITVEVTKPSGEVITSQMNSAGYESASAGVIDSTGRNLFQTTGYPFGLSEFVGKTVTIKVTW